MEVDSSLQLLSAGGVKDAMLYSFLETVPVDSGDRTAVYVSQGRFEAPNWTRDGKAFLFNRDGRLLRLPVTGGNPETDRHRIRQYGCNNDHGISPDSTLLAISDQSQERPQVAGLRGADYRRRRRDASPKMRRRTGMAGRRTERRWRSSASATAISTFIPFRWKAAKRRRLTTAPGLDDGPEYSPDGQYIYFNSERTGHMQIWRMKVDGSEQEQVFSDDYNNWFPHISPDGKYMVFLTFDKSVSGHPENKDVTLRLMSLADKKIKVLATLFGGQGTNNVPSWSPDSKKVAFVSYAMVPQANRKNAKSNLTIILTIVYNNGRYG